MADDQLSKDPTRIWSSRGSRRLAVLLCLGLLAASQWRTLPRLASTGAPEYLADEGYWIAAGDYHFQLFFVERDWSLSSWNTDRFREWGPRTGPIGKYTIGLGLHAAGVGGRYRGAPPWDFSKPFAWNEARGSVSALDELVPARFAISLAGSVAAIGLFLLLRELLGSWMVGAVAAAFFLLSPLTLRYSAHAMVDIPMLAFSLLALWCAAKTFNHADTRRVGHAIAWAGAAGVAIGLAIGTKLNALLIPVVVALWAISRLTTSAARPSGGERSHSAIAIDASAGVVAFATAGATFFLLNPFLYPAPIAHLRFLWELGQIVSGYSGPTIEPQRLNGILARAAAIPSVLLGDRGLLSASLGTRWADLPLVLAGGLVIVQRTIRTSDVRYGAVLLWLVVQVIGILGWTPFRWERWFIPLLPLTSLFEAVGCLRLLEWMWARRSAAAARVRSKLG